MSAFASMTDPEKIARVLNTPQNWRRLNVASGNHPSGPWGVDFDLNFDGNVRADARWLPFAAHSFEEAYMGHFLEHVPWGDIPAVLGEIRRTLQHGATAMAVGPCIFKAMHTAQPDWLIDAILCDPQTTEPPGIHHAWTPTEKLTVEAMIRGGFVNVEPVPIASVDRPRWPNPSIAPWQCAVRGTNPAWKV